MFISIINLGINFEHFLQNQAESGGLDEIKQNVNENKKPGSVTLSVDTIKNIAGYLKKINPDDLNKTLNTVQKVIQIIQTVGGNKTGNINLGSSVYNDWWD